MVLELSPRYYVLLSLAQVRLWAPSSLHFQVSLQRTWLSGGLRARREGDENLRTACSGTLEQDQGARRQNGHARVLLACLFLHMFFDTVLD